MPISFLGGADFLGLILFSLVALTFIDSGIYREEPVNFVDCSPSYVVIL